MGRAFQYSVSDILSRNSRLWVMEQEKSGPNAPTAVTWRYCGWKALPNEVLDLVFSFLQDSKDVLSVARVCKSSCSSSQARLYRRVTYTTRVSGLSLSFSSDATKIVSMEKLAITLAWKPDLAARVRAAYIGGTDSTCERAATAVLKMLSINTATTEIYVDSWPTFDPNIARLRMKAIDLHQNLLALENHDAAAERFATVLGIPGLTKVTLVQSERHLYRPNRPGLWADEPDTTHSETKPPIIRADSSVRELLFDHGCVPSPSVLRKIIARIKRLEYLYLDFCFCSFSAWHKKRFCFVELNRLLSTHRDSLRTLVVKISSGNGLATCHPISFVKYKALEFLRLPLDVMLPWRLVAGKHSLPPSMPPRLPKSMAPQSLRTLVLSVDSTFSWIQTSFPLTEIWGTMEPNDDTVDSWDGDSEWEADAAHVLLNEVAETQTAEAGTQTVEAEDGDATEVDQMQVELTREALLLLAWLRRFGDEGTFPQLRDLVIVQPYCLGKTKVAQLPQIQKLGTELARKGILFQLTQ